MAHHRIRRGLDIPIAGAASGSVVDLDLPDTVGFDPRELRGFIPRLAAREGDAVKRGQPLFFHKFDPRVKIVSPVTGRVAEVRRGHRRVITDFVVAVDGLDDAVQHKAWSLAELAGIGRANAVEQMCEGGVWPLLRSRPLDHVANPDVVPQAILIDGMETGPLQPGADVLLGAGDGEALQAAVHVLKALTDGEVFLTHAASGAPAVLTGVKGVTAHTFEGPHPAGDASVQVNLICPPRGTGKVFYLKAWDAVAIGKLFLTGTYDPHRVIAAVGAAVKTPRFVRTVVGAPVAHIVGAVQPGELRWINGSILTGTRTKADRWSSWYSRSVHVLSDEVPRAILGWALPSVGTWSFHKAFLKGWSGHPAPVDMRPGLFGGHRGIVPTGVHDQVIATPDLLPTFLFRQLLAGDIEGAVRLGMLDISEEEAALCAYICPSKIDYDVVLRESLETYAKETGA